ncbi:hypothetical protein Peur_011816 [Populus x canadensis]
MQWSCVRLTLPFEVETRRLKEPNKLLVGVEKYYGIDIEYMRKNRSVSSTRANTSAVQIDTSFEGLGAGIISLVKGNPVANLATKAIWHFLHTICVPVNCLHAQVYVSTDCEPCTRPGLPWQYEKEGRCCREEGKAKERGLHKGNIESEDALSNEHINGVAPFTNGDRVAHVFNSQNLISLSRPGIENFARLEIKMNAMEDSYVELAAKPVNAKVKVGNFRVDGEQKAFAKQKIQLWSIISTKFSLPPSL